MAVTSSHLMSTRNQIIKTPGKVVLDAAGVSPVTLYSSTGITCRLQETLVDLVSTRWGVHDQVTTGRLVRIELEPTQFTAAGLAAIFTHLSTAGRLGGSIVGATDKKCYVATVDGQRREMDCAFVYQEPPMRCAAGKTILGQMVIYGIVGLGGNPASLDTFWKKLNSAWSDADWDPAHELTPSWNFAWSKGTASAWDDIDTRGEGVTVTPRSSLAEDVSTRDGLKNVTLTDYGVDVTASVMNIEEALILEAMGWGNKLGTRKSSLGRDLVLRAVTNDAFITVRNAVLQPDYQFGLGAENTVVADLAWKSMPLVTAGVRDPHLLVTTEDPLAY